MNQLALNRDHPPAWLPGAIELAAARADMQSSERADSQRAPAAVRLFDAFNDIGGVVDGDALSTLLRGRTEQPIAMVARWIVQRDVLSFPWHSQTLLPLFQFDLRSVQVRPGVRRVIAELRATFDDVELADWFARPNSWLLDRAPARWFEDDLPAVLQAARADRFVAVGN